MKKSIFSRRVISVFLSLFLFTGMFSSYGIRDSVSAASSTYSVSLTAAQIWERPESSPYNNYRTFTSLLPTSSTCSYAVTSYVPDTDGYYSITTTSGANPLYDPMLYIYKDGFDPSTPTVNFIMGNDDPDDFSVTRYSALLPGELFMTAGTTYYIVTTSYYTYLDTFSPGLGDVNLTIEGPYYAVNYSAGSGGVLTDSNGAPIVSAPQYILSGQDGPIVDAVPDPGYHFVSWSDGYPTALRTDTDIMGDIDAAASFADKYSLKYAADSNGTISGNADQLVLPNTSGTQIEAVANQGYHFVSWSDGYLTALRTDDNVTADVNALANFEANIYNVSFDAQGGTPVTGITAPYNTLITAPAVPSMAGYTFGGWYKDAACTTAWDFAVDAVTSDTILYAAWTINSYTVTFQDWDGTVLGAQLVRYGDDAVAPAAPLRSGYTFESWSEAFTDVADNTTVEAVYRLNATPAPTAEPTTEPTAAPTTSPTAVPTTTVFGVAKTGETDNSTGMIIGIALLLGFGAVTTIYVIRKKKIKD